MLTLSRARAFLLSLSYVTEENDQFIAELRSISRIFSLVAHCVATYIGTTIDYNFSLRFILKVPIVNRASFDVRVLGCVWLVAPGPPESLMTAWEDHQHAYADGQSSVEEDGAAVPSSPGNASVRWGLFGDSPKASSTPVTFCPCTFLVRVMILAIP